MQKNNETNIKGMCTVSLHSYNVGLEDAAKKSWFSDTLDPVFGMSHEVSEIFFLGGGRGILSVWLPNFLENYAEFQGTLNYANDTNYVIIS